MCPSRLLCPITFIIGHEDDVSNDGISDVTSGVRGKSQRRLHRTLREKLPLLVHGKPNTDQGREDNVGEKHRLQSCQPRFGSSSVDPRRADSQCPMSLDTNNVTVENRLATINRQFSALVQFQARHPCADDIVSLYHPVLCLRVPLVLASIAKP